MSKKNSSWNMDLTGFVPGFSDLVDEGYYLTEVVSASEDTLDKGNVINLAFRILEGPFSGKTVTQKMFILDKDFSGSDGHGKASLSNWYSLFVALNIKPGKFDARKAAAKLIGQTIGVQVTHSPGTNKKGEKVTYANVNDFLRPEAISELAPKGDDTDADDSPEGEVLEAVAEKASKPKKKKAKPAPEPEVDEDDSDEDDSPEPEDDSSDEDDSDDSEVFDLDSLA